ncbi:putative nucleotide-binding alpha-beta plait domain superfamily, RNA-binding domain superfamily [Helianthus annuus]|nr:putative nucleotide-binding alpha-beta plait domain superfamily, RNA-binding domain superfamily [Helianthus annuus]KAJ0517029.1 putative nucleotide-binding alpha-beta plait domain superfamily, RNA-binding domain superfamily [Helianthus annuus]KAJ0685038.1 putative nucleotide-binding alpha-beta plait domain superfamily, RNA-binding domain superfamily [Helianthus annuus]KAJ0688961.1 putative nucleotide-binding alpha-beta plait domain superfamily, RNA-binding domain superfamily [Helianthus annuu
MVCLTTFKSNSDSNCINVVNHEEQLEELTEVGGVANMRNLQSGKSVVEQNNLIGSKRPRMTETNPEFAVSSSSSGGYNPPTIFPVVRLRGPPFNCTYADIFKIFIGLEIVDSLLVNKSGLFSGEAFVVFSRPVQTDISLQKNRQCIGQRYIEVFKCKKQEYYNAVAAEVGHDNGY